jgi:hypothetical protein
MNPLPVARVDIGPLASEVFGALRVLPRRLEQAGFTSTNRTPRPSLLRPAHE